MTARSLPSLRDALLLLFVSFLTAAFAFQMMKATPTDRPLVEMREPKAVHAPPPVSLRVEAGSASILDAAETPPSTAMPLERDIQTLRGLREMPKNGVAETRGWAAHRMSALAASKENDLYLRALRPALRDLLYDDGAPKGSRLMALAALYKISLEHMFYAPQNRIDREPSAHVHATAEDILKDEWTPEIGRLQV